MDDSFAQKTERLIQNIAGVVVAREEVLRLAATGLLAGGHLLLNDLPGVGKTLLARSLAWSMGVVFKRIQFTPDLLPTDITGASVYHQGRGEFQFIPGPVFANIVLADEINRASTRTQAALLEAMGEGQVTVDGQTYVLPRPFWVIATQNEVDSYGTFPLPHAQLDRFLMSLSLGYPSDEQQVTILERSEHGEATAGPALAAEELARMQGQVLQVAVARPVKEYVARLLAATRRYPQVVLGVSPRGGVQLQRAAQAWAALHGRSYVAPEDVKAVAVATLAHRLLIDPSAATSAREMVTDLLTQVPVPV
ncbi:MAG: MoxR family ATPase [Chloroflexi bacterium]|nr:MoxR family ATPase [Chloroflexota bacterium]